MVLVQNYITPCQAYLPNASSSQVSCRILLPSCLALIMYPNFKSSFSLIKVDVMHQLGWFRSGHNRRAPGCVIRSENVTETSTSSCQG